MLHSREITCSTRHLPFSPVTHCAALGTSVRGHLLKPNSALGASRRVPLSSCPPKSRLSKCSSAASEAPGGNNLPRSPVEMTQQAAECVAAGISQGLFRQTLELLLPVNEKERDFLATEADDYPCSLQREFDVACALTKSLLQRALGDQGAAISARRLDDGGVEGEPCAVLFPKEPYTGRIAAVVYPTADRLRELQELAKDAGRALLIINPQWREEGQVISDFGIGPWKKAALDFLAQFEPAYYLKEKRIGSPGTIDTVTGMRFGSGGVVRVLRRWPGHYECYATAADGSSQLMVSCEKEPKYNDLDAMITAGRQRKLPIFSIARLATYVYADDSDEASKWRPGDGSSSNSGGGMDGAQAEKATAATDRDAGGRRVSDADIEAMDSASLRRLLASHGEPTSGKISKLRERLREVAAQRQERC